MCKKAKNSARHSWEAEKKLGRPAALAMPRTARQEAPESEGQLRESHQEHIADKGDHSLYHYGLVRTPVPMPEEMHISLGKE